MAEPNDEAPKAARQAKQDVALARRVSGDLYRRSRFNRARLDRSGLGRRGIHSADDLGKLPPLELGDLSSVADLLTIVRPSRNRRYGAACWAAHGNVPLAYSAQDLRQLAELGAEVFERAGAAAGDVVIDLAEACSPRDRIQLRSGAQKAGLPLVSVEDESDVATMLATDASVLAGDVEGVTIALDAIARSGEDTRIHTAIVAGDPFSEDQKLRTAAGNTAVSIVWMWAPPGVLAAWSECRGGEGFHTFPESELIEIVDDASGLRVLEGSAGALLWTGTGWYGSALLRLRTDAFGVLETTRCENCRRTVPRFIPQTERTSFCDLLEVSPDVAAWSAELHSTFKGDELSIWIAPTEGASALNVLTSVSERIGPAHVHIVDKGEVEAIVEAANGERYGDRRAFSTDGSSEA